MTKILGTRLSKPTNVVHINSEYFRDNRMNVRVVSSLYWNSMTSLTMHSKLVGIARRHLGRWLYVIRGTGSLYFPRKRSGIVQTSSNTLFFLTIRRKYDVVFQTKYQEWRSIFAAERRGAAEPPHSGVVRTGCRPSPDCHHGAQAGAAGQEVDGEVETAVNAQQKMGDFDEIRDFLEIKNLFFQTF